MSSRRQGHRGRLPGTPSDSSASGSTRSDNDRNLITLSKALSWILRHGAVEENIAMSEDGFVDIQVLLNHRRFKKYTVEDIKMVVENNDKQRFAMREDPTAGLQIRANQGHSLEVKDLALTPIQNASEYPVVIHGTYLKYWKSISESGLRRMKRQHIHLTTGMPGESGVISGMRASADIYINIDMQKALTDGIPFYISENNVILTPGNEEGVLETKYFSKVTNRKSGLVMSVH